MLDDSARSHAPAPVRERATLSVLVENKAGVLARVTGLFARRNYNILSLNVAPTDSPKHSRITIVYDAERTTEEQVVKQLNKLINVLRIDELDAEHSVERELMLVTVQAGADHRSEIIELVQISEGKIVDVGHNALTISVVGRSQKLDDFAELIKPFGITSMARSGAIALQQLDRSQPKLRPVPSAAEAG